MRHAPHAKFKVIDAHGQVVGRLVYVAHEDESDAEQPLSYSYSADSTTATPLYKVVGVRSSDISAR